MFTYEARGPGDADRLVSRRPGCGGAGRPSTSWPESSTRPRRRPGLPLTRRPDPGFVGLAHAWAAGEDLAEVIADEEMSGGDFVRNVKQLIDLLRQLGDQDADPARGPVGPGRRGCDCSGA